MRPCPSAATGAPRGLPADFSTRVRFGAPRFLSLWILACLWTLLSLGAGPVKAQTEFTSLVDYISRLEAAAAQLDDWAAQSEPSPAALAAALESLTGVEQVRLPAGETLTPAWPDWQPAEMKPEQAAALAAALSQLADQLAVAAHDETDTRLDLLAEIFTRPSFTEQESWADRFWRWLNGQISRWFPDWQSTQDVISTPIFTWVGWVVIGAAVVILIILGSYWLQGFWASMIGESRLRAPGTTDDIPPNAATARAQAQLAAAAGDYRQAVRRLYLTALLLLDEQRLLNFDRSQTNRETLARLPDDSLLRPHLTPVVETFDAVWYGLREPDETTYERYTREIDALDAAARRTAQEHAQQRAQQRGQQRGQSAQPRPTERTP